MAATDGQQLQTIEFPGFKAELPAGWVKQQTTSSMRIQPKGLQTK